MKRIAIIGSGDLGQLIAHHAVNDQGYTLAGFIDDFKQKGDDVGVGKILGKTTELELLYQSKVFDYLMVGIGYKHFHFRKEIFERFKGKIPYANIIHSSAYVDKSCRLGEGIFILPGCVLDKGVKLEDNVLLNTGVIIAHDSTVKKHAFLGPAVKMAGFITVGECSFIGINTTIIDNIQICAETQTGGGSVVIKNIEEKGLYVGIPARKVK